MSNFRINSWLKERYLKMMGSLTSARERAAISPILYSQNQIVTSFIKEYAYGKCIDLGCGQAPFLEELYGIVSEYDTLDIERKIDFLTFEADIEDLSIIPDERYDTALCLDVLEHVPHPWKALLEIKRILKPNGFLILSVPHLSRLHEVPHDYYRFTEFGLRTLLEEIGFSVISIKKRGGLLSFLAHQCSLFIMIIFWPIPIIRKLGLFICRFFSLIVWKLDEFIKSPNLFPAGYVIVAKRM